MTFDFWGLGLQALNAVILIWLLSRVFWRPVAAAIARRRAAAQTLLGDAKATQGKADAALAELTAARAGIAAERDKVLAEAKDAALAIKADAQSEAHAQAEAIMAAARNDMAREADTARAAMTAQAGELAVDIARKLLGELPGEAVQTAFLQKLTVAIAALPSQDRAALVGAKGVDLICPTDPSADAKTEITSAVQQALGAAVVLNFVTDPALIAGYELHSDHFVLHNSWQADLAAILKELCHAD
jgi:F-type H+-transporting ATPase subunit b